MWPQAFLRGHYARCGDEHIAFISSAIISSGQAAAEPTKAASRLLTHLHFPTTRSSLISTVEMKLGVITEFLASGRAAQPTGLLAGGSSAGANKVEERYDGTRFVC